MVGLYLNPPDKAVVLCMDEKSQIQALDRTQASLADEKGTGGHDDPRLQAQRHDHALCRAERLTGVVIGQCLPKHRNSEFLKFLRTIDSQVPKELADPYDSATTTARTATTTLLAWLEKHPRFHLHFIPTSSSWLNMVERWFRDLTDKAHPPGGVQVGARSDRRHRGVSRCPQRRPQAIRLDRHGRGHPREGPPGPSRSLHQTPVKTETLH